MGSPGKSIPHEAVGVRRGFEEGIEESYARLSMSILHYVEDCVGCMSCRVACPYWRVDHRYSPVNKAEELRYMYRRTLTVSGRILGRLAKASIPGTREEALRIMDLAYKCSECGACYTTCPFGIDSGELINILRGILARAGYAPTVLRVLAEVELKGFMNRFPEVMAQWKRVIEDTEKMIGRKPPLDSEADIVFIPSFFDAFLTPRAISCTAYILERVGLSWTMPSAPLLFKPFASWHIGDLSSSILIAERLGRYIEKVKGRTLLVVDGGTYYYFMRWVYPEHASRKQGYNVKHIVELVQELYKKGRIRLGKVEGRITWHSPCKLGRRGGATKEPLEVLRAIAPGYKDLPHHGLETICCGGGGGVALQTQECMRKLEKLTGIKIRSMLDEEEKKYLYRQEKTYYLALERKARDIEKIKPDIVVTGCPTCILSLNHASLLYGPSYETLSFPEIVAEALMEAEKNA